VSRNNNFLIENIKKLPENEQGKALANKQSIENNFQNKMRSMFQKIGSDYAVEVKSPGKKKSRITNVVGNTDSD